MITAYSYSESGGHATNEDCCAVFQHPDDPNCWLCAVADGHGGRAGGRRAAQIACLTLTGLAERQPVSRLADDRIWESLFREVDQEVSADAEAGFTTLIGFGLVKDRIIGGSNGDSAVAVFDNLRDWEELTNSQIKNPPIGSGAAAFVPFAKALRHSWRVLAMSDGVWKYARWDRIHEAAKSLRGEALISTLQKHARLPGSGKFQDDFTLITLEKESE